MLRSSSALLLALVATWVSAAPKLQVVPDHDTGVYALGEEAAWLVTATDEGKPLAGRINYAILSSGLNRESQGQIELTVDGHAKITAPGRDKPGATIAEVTYEADGKRISARGGAAYAPEKIPASAPVPDDFDEFWKAKIAELDAVPMNVQLEKVDIGDPKIEYYKVTLDNIRGSKIYGQLAKPVGDGKFPALLQVQWAGVYPLHRDWVVGPARQGRLAFNITAHDLPIDEKEEFYKEKAGKELNDYPGQGNDDREQSYFLRMFLSCRRAVDYLTQRDDWNKKSLLVTGGSQGGYQAIVTAGLHPAVTAFAANVPAGCDHTGKAVGRAPGWPNWAGRTWQGKDEKKMLHAARYFDAMNFATRVKCPGLIGVGLVDPVCPVEGVLATCNQLQGPRKVVLMPQADHGQDHKAYYAVFGKFLDEHLK